MENKENKKIWDKIFNAEPAINGDNIYMITDNGELTPAVPLGYDEEQMLYSAVRNIIENAIKSKQYKTYQIETPFVETFDDKHNQIKPFDVIYLFTGNWAELMFPVLVRTITETQMNILYLGGKDNEDVISEIITIKK